ncbi:MAG: hypothetical protein ABL908_08010 [Hyphomicrobium sp.]
MAASLVFSACTNVQEIATGFQLLTFVEDANSGVTDQTLEVRLVGLGGESSEPIQFGSATGEDTLLTEAYRSCLPYKDASPLGALLVPYLKQAGEFLFESAIKAINSRAAELSRRSTATAKNTILLPNRNEWDRVRCIVLIRHPKANKGATSTQASQATQIVIIRKQKRSENFDAYTLIPIYARMTNARAVTGVGENGGPGMIAVDISLGVTYVATPKAARAATTPELRQASIISIPKFSAAIGSAAKLCESGTSTSFKTCKFETDLIPNVATNAAPIVLSISLVETGSGASAEEQAKAATKAMDAIIHPHYTKALDRFTKGLSH